MNRRIFASLAILVMALNALWPLLVTAQPKTIPTEICSVSGAKTIAAADGSQNLPVSGAHHGNQPNCCNFCVSGVHAAPIAPALAGVVLNLDPAPLPLASADSLTWKCPYYLPTLSRGPPASPI